MNPKTEVTVSMIGEDESAFAMLTRVRRALRKAGHDDLAREFMKEAATDNHDHLLQTCMKYVHCD